MKKILSVILSLMLVFAGMAPAALAADTADVTLSDISYENHSVTIGDFNPEITSYTVEQPYRFSKDGNNYPEPEVIATPTDPNADVSINSVWNADKKSWTTTIVVSNGDSSKTYTLTSRPVGRNQYSNGGFEDGGLEDSGNAWKKANLDTFEIVSEKAYSGSKSLHASGSTSVSYPYQDVNLPTDQNVTYFAFFAVNSTKSVKPTEPSIYANNSSKGDYMDDDGKVLTAEGEGENLLTTKDSDGWQRSMRVLKGLSILRETAIKTSSESILNAYFDEFYVAPLVVSNVNLTSDKQNYVFCGAEETVIDFDAEILNQYGNKAGIGEQDITWKLIGAPDTMEIDTDGKLTIPTTMEPCSFYVEAQVTPSFNQGITSDWKTHCQTWMGGRMKVGVLPTDAVAQLSDIEVNGGSLVTKFNDKNEASIYVPYVYKENDFNNFAMPVVKATPVDPEGDAIITYPGEADEPVTDGEKIYIDVTDASGILSTRYILTIKTVGGNLFPDGGFEVESVSNYKNDDYGKLELTIKEDESTSAGKQVMKVVSAYDSAGNSPILSYIGGGQTGVTIQANKTYVNGLIAKSDPEKPEGNTCVNFAPGIKGGAISYSTSDSCRRKKYTEDVYYSHTGDPAGKTLTLNNNWQKVMTVFSSDPTLNVRVGMAMPVVAGLKDTYFLLDEMYLGELVVANMAVTDEDGKTSGTVAAGETITLTEKHTNQYGNSVGLTGTTTWEVLNNTDVTVDSNGNVTVKDDAAAGTAIIEATFDTDYTGAAQDVVKKRYALTVIPQDGIVDNENGTYTANYTNNTDKDMTLRFISALYEGEVLQTVVITDNITVKVGETYSGSNTLTAGSGQSVRNFLWDKTTLVPVIAK